MVEVIPVGIGAARWMLVTARNDDGSITGHVWSAKRLRWTKGTTTYARSAIRKQTPRCARPDGYLRMSFND